MYERCGEIYLTIALKFLLDMANGADPTLIGKM